MIYQKENEKGKIYFASKLMKSVVLSTSKKGSIYVHSFIRFHNEIELPIPPGVPQKVPLCYNTYPVSPARSFDLYWGFTRYQLLIEDVILYPIEGMFHFDPDNEPGISYISTMTNQVYHILGVELTFPRRDYDNLTEAREFLCEKVFGPQLERENVYLHKSVRKLLEHLFGTLEKRGKTRVIEWESEKRSFIILPQLPQNILFVIKCLPEEVERLLKILRDELRHIPLPPSKLRFRIILRSNKIVYPIPLYTKEEVRRALHSKSESEEVIKYPIIEIERLLWWED